MSITERHPVTVFPGTVLVDDREKAPFPFTGFRGDARQGRLPLVVPTRRVRLASGDYSLEGYEATMAVERKSRGDLFGTLGQRRKAFEAELERLAAMEYAAVVVEADWHQIIHEPTAHSQLLPKVVFRSVIAWQQRYAAIHWWFLPSRRLAEAATLRILERFARNH